MPAGCSPSSIPVGRSLFAIATPQLGVQSSPYRASEACNGANPPMPGVVFFVLRRRNDLRGARRAISAGSRAAAGVGYQTTQGMGQCRRIAEMPREAREGQVAGAG